MTASKVAIVKKLLFEIKFELDCTAAPPVDNDDKLPVILDENDA